MYGNELVPDGVDVEEDGIRADGNERGGGGSDVRGRWSHGAYVCGRVPVSVCTGRTMAMVGSRKNVTARLLDRVRDTLGTETQDPLVHSQQKARQVRLRNGSRRKRRRARLQEAFEAVVGLYMLGACWRNLGQCPQRTEWAEGEFHGERKDTRDHSVPLGRRPLRSRSITPSALTVGAICAGRSVC